VTRTAAAFAFTAVVLRRVLRDRAALFFMIVLPVIVIVVIGATFGGQGRLDIGLVQLDHGPFAERVAHAMRSSDGVTVHDYGTVAALRRAARRQTIAAGIVLDRSFDEAIAGGRTARPHYVVSPAADQALTAEIALQGIVAPIAGRVAAARFAARTTGKPFATTLAAAEELGGASAARVSVRNVGDTHAADVSRFSQTAPQNLVLFVFITSLASGSLIVQARRQGVLRRAVATRTGVGTILFGLGLGWFSIALVQSVIILAVGAIFFGVDWGAPLPAALLVIDFAMVGCGAGLLLGALGRDEDKVSSIAPVLGIVLGALGGCMIPLEVFPPAMLAAAHAVPQYWAVRSWRELIFEGAGTTAIAPALGVLALYAAALGAAAAVLLRRSLTG
jgi:linearmycin/streptolysin S transport system permease protein